MTELPTPNTNEAFLSQIQDDEENYNIVLSIREELMERVMDECYKSYIKKQTVKFIVQCAYDALVKFLTFDFYYHPEIPDISQSIWIADKPIEPSPRDTWACDAVPIRPVDFQEEEQMDLIYESVSFLGMNKTEDHKETSSSEEFKSCICLERICSCLTGPEDISKKLDSTYSRLFSSKVKFSPKSSKQSMMKHSDSTSEKQSSNEIISTESRQSHIQVSDKSLSSRDLTSSGGFSSSGNLGAKRGRMSKSPKKAQEIKEAATDVLPDSLHGSQADVVELPPIRINSTFHSKAAELKKKIKR